MTTPEEVPNSEELWEWVKEISKGRREIRDMLVTRREQHLSSSTRWDKVEHILAEGQFQIEKAATHLTAIEKGI